MRSRRAFFPIVCGPTGRGFVVGLVSLIASLSPAPSVGAEAPGGTERAAVGKALSPTAMILRREAPGGHWQTVAQDESLSSQDLLLGLPGADLQSQNGAVVVSFLSNLDGGATN